jgi:hypothetical protein
MVDGKWKMGTCLRLAGAEGSAGNFIAFLAGYFSAFDRVIG